MAETLSTTKRTVECLEKHPGKKMTAWQIAEWIFENYKEECLEKRERSTAKKYPLRTDKGLKAQIARQIGSGRKRIERRYSKIKTIKIEDEVIKFYFTESSGGGEITEAESQEDSSAKKLKEHDLYPLLSEFLWSELKIYSKRIDETRSTNSRGAGGNKWLYPDLVAMENLSSDWHPKIKECVKGYADKKSKLWSFEVKKSIDQSDVREAFFQAVSNSSWANFGYLVATEISGVRTLKELRMLANLHGIGFITLNIDEPSESQITIPAKERNDIDWDTASRLTEENPDFKEYIELIREFYSDTRIRSADWDAVVDGDEDEDEDEDED